MASSDTEPLNEGTIPVTLKELEELAKHASSGDQQAVAALRQLLDDHPQLWQTIGDMGRMAETSIIAVAANGNLLISESIRRQAAELRSELLGDHYSPLEKLAADRVITSWLMLQLAESRQPKDSANLQLIRYLEQLKSGAQRRFDAAMKSLLLVREKQLAIARIERPMLRILRTG